MFIAAFKCCYCTSNIDVRKALAKLLADPIVYVCMSCDISLLENASDENFNTVIPFRLLFCSSKVDKNILWFIFIIYYEEFDDTKRGNIVLIAIINVREYWTGHKKTENREKMATHDRDKQNRNTTQHVPDTTTRKQTRTMTWALLQTIVYQLII